MFRDQISYNMEVYVNDILVKSHASWSQIEDLKENIAML